MKKILITLLTNVLMLASCHTNHQTIPVRPITGKTHFLYDNPANGREHYCMLRGTDTLCGTWDQWDSLTLRDYHGQEIIISWPDSIGNIVDVVIKADSIAAYDSAVGLIPNFRVIEPRNQSDTGMLIYGKGPWATSWGFSKGYYKFFERSPWDTHIIHLKYTKGSTITNLFTTMDSVDFYDKKLKWPN